MVSQMFVYVGLILGIVDESVILLIYLEKIYISW